MNPVDLDSKLLFDGNRCGWRWGGGCRGVWRVEMVEDVFIYMYTCAHTCTYARAGAEVFKSLCMFKSIDVLVCVQVDRSPLLRAAASERPGGSGAAARHHQRASF